MANLGSITALKDNSIDTSVTTNGAGLNTGSRVNVCLNDIVDTLTGGPVVSTGVSNPSSIFASAAQGLLAESALQPADVQPVAVEGVLTGNTIWVDAVNGDDATAVVGRQDLPFLTLTDAKDAASAGYTIRVRPGAYVVSESISVNGVNWHFETGASVLMTTDANGSIFDDGGSAMSFTVTGSGVFTRGETSQPEAYANVIHMSDPGSEFTVYCDQIMNTANEESGDIGLPGTSAIYHGDGTLSVFSRIIEAQGYAYYWRKGPAWITADSITSNGNAAGDGDAIYCAPPDGNADDVFIRAQLIKAVNGSAVYSSITFSSAPLFRLWVIAESIAGGGYGIQHSSGKMYVTAQKISVSVDGATIISGGNIGTELYVTSQKIGISDTLTDLVAGVTILFSSAAKVRLNAMEYDLSPISSSASILPLFSVNSDFEINTVVNGGTVRLPSSLDVPIISNSISSGGGTRRFVNMVMDNSAVGASASAPIVLTDDLTVLNGCTIVTAASSSIAAAAAQDVVSYGSYANNAVDSNVTVDGLLTVGAYVA